MENSNIQTSTKSDIIENMQRIRDEYAMKIATIPLGSTDMLEMVKKFSEEFKTAMLPFENDIYKDFNEESHDYNFICKTRQLRDFVNNYIINIDKSNLVKEIIGICDSDERECTNQKTTD